MPSARLLLPRVAAVLAVCLLEPMASADVEVEGMSAYHGVVGRRIEILGNGFTDDATVLAFNPGGELVVPQVVQRSANRVHFLVSPKLDAAILFLRDRRDLFVLLPREIEEPSDNEDELVAVVKPGEVRSRGHDGVLIVDPQGSAIDGAFGLLIAMKDSYVRMDAIGAKLAFYERKAKLHSPVDSLVRLLEFDRIRTVTVPRRFSVDVDEDAITTFDGGIGHAKALIISADDKTTALIGSDGCVREVEIDRKSQRVRIVDALDERVMLVSGATGGSALALTESGRFSRYMMGGKWHLLNERNSTHRHVYALAISKSGEYVAMAERDGKLRLGRIDRQNLVVQELGEHGAPVTRLEVSSDGKLVASYGLDERILLWSSDKTDKPRELQLDGSASSARHRDICALRISPDNGLLAVSDGRLRLFDLPNAVELLTPNWRDSVSDVMLFSKGANFLATADGGGTIRLYDVKLAVDCAAQSNKQRTRLSEYAKTRSREIEEMKDLSFEESFKLRSALSNEVRANEMLLECESPLVRQYEGCDGEVATLQFSHRGDRLYAAEKNGTIHVLEVPK